MEIKKVPVSVLKTWDKNPRSINKKDFERLKKQIKELGVYKPLIAYKENSHYVVLGGNMRLKAFQALGILNVEISLIYPKSEAEKLKYALSDNDRAGNYVEQDLAEILHAHKGEVELSNYNVDLGKTIGMDKFLEIQLGDLDDLEGQSKLTGKGKITCPKCKYEFESSEGKNDKT